MKLTTRIASISLIYIVSLFLFQCMPLEEKEIKIGFSQDSSTILWRNTMLKEMKREVVFYPEAELIVKDAEDDPQKQIKQIYELVNQDKVDILIICPIDAPTLESVVEDLHKKGIKVIVIDGKINTEFYTAFIGGNNIRLGQIVGNHLKSKFKEGAEVLEITGAEMTASSIDRSHGFHKSIENSNVKVTETVVGNWSPDIAYKKCLELFKTKKFDAVFAYSDEMGISAYKAWKDSDGVDKPHFMGVNGLPEIGMKGVEDKQLDISFINATGGDRAIELAMKVLNGEPYEKVNYLKMGFIRPSNARLLRAQNERLDYYQNKIEKQKTIFSAQLLKYDEQSGQLQLVSALLIFALLLAVVIIMLFFRIRNKKKLLEALNSEIVAQKTEIESQNEEILQQRDVLDEKNIRLKESNEMITASIQYAQKIQEAILPDDSFFKDHFAEHFIVYRPKDIVSGDFYWTAEENNKLYLAVVDCTGHGVPGAFMSMIGSTLLNRIVKELHLEEPDEILEKLDQEIRIALRQDEAKNDDGMDMVIAVLDKSEEEQLSMKIAGAKSNFYLYMDGEISMVKGVNRGIGGMYKKERSFECHNIKLKKGDVVYLLTDGIIDQNNPQRKRIGSHNFKSILTNHSHINLNNQKSEILKVLEEHKGNMEQRDDITVLGIRL